MNTLAARIRHAAELDGTVTFVSGDDHAQESWASLLADAEVMAAALHGRGVYPGDHVGIFAPTSRDVLVCIEAIWLCGATLVMVPIPMRLSSLEHVVAQTQSRLATAEVTLVLCDEMIKGLLDLGADAPPMISFEELRSTASGDPSTACGGPSTASGDPSAPIEVDPDSLAILQFTSGSTSAPKGVMLTHRQVCANLDAIMQASELRPGDTIVSWLPLYHDMGLVGLMLTPMTTGLNLVQGAPQDFLSKPVRWLEWISKYRGVATAGPNFSYSLATRALRRATELDLSSLRICLNGAEPVDPQGFRKFLEAAAAFGLNSEAAFPAFGMAELCIGGTFPQPGSGLRTDVVDREALEHQRLAVPVDPSTESAREFAFLGFAVPGLELRIVEPSTGDLLADREVGELQIRGTSTTSGYYNNPEATNELLRDGWLRTGDLAYLVDGEMVVCGRIKDLIIVGGRNVYPQDVERVVGQVSEVRIGNVICFGIEGTGGKEFVIVVAETRTERPDELVEAITSEVIEEIGVPPREVVLVAPGTIPKTSSGKLQRAACKAEFLNGELVRINPSAE